MTGDLFVKKYLECQLVYLILHLSIEMLKQNNFMMQDLTQNDYRSTAEISNLPVHLKHPKEYSFLITLWKQISCRICGLNLFYDFNLNINSNHSQVESLRWQPLIYINIIQNHDLSPFRQKPWRPRYELATMSF